jgi:ANTAR domain
MSILLWGGPGAGEIVDQEIDDATPDAVVELGDYSGGIYRILGRLPPGSPAEYLADWAVGSTTEISTQIAHYEKQHTADQGTIAELQAGGVADRGVIEHLLSDGLIDRNKILNLEAALVSARRIGAAIGIVMASRKVTEDQAFTILRRASETTNRKLRVVADDVLFTGHVDPK